MRIKATVLVGLIMCMSLFAAEKTQDRIPVFIKSAGSVGGFTDPSKDRQDSTKDLLKRLRSSDTVVPVESEKDALAVLEVVDRDTKRETNVFGKQNKSYLTVRLTAGEYSVEFTGESGSKGVITGYGAAAEKVVKQLEAWVTANHDRLLALKK